MMEAMTARMEVIDDSNAPGGRYFWVAMAKHVRKAEEEPDIPWVLLKRMRGRRRRSRGFFCVGFGLDDRVVVVGVNASGA